MIETRPTPPQAMAALERLAAKMIDLFNTDDDYYWGGENDAEPDWVRFYALFEYATGYDLSDETQPHFEEFQKWGLKATEAEIVAEALRLARQIRNPDERAMVVELGRILTALECLADPNEAICDGIQRDCDVALNMGSGPDLVDVRKLALNLVERVSPHVRKYVQDHC